MCIANNICFVWNNESVTQDLSMKDTIHLSMAGKGFLTGF